MSASRPNIILFFTDQQRADAVGADGNPVIRTPNLDRLAAEGTLFTSAYTPSPVCVSARCSLIMGQYPAKTGCSDNGHPRPMDQPTFMQKLTDAGYRTHGIGKMHFSPDPEGMHGLQSRQYQDELGSQVEGNDYLEFLHANGFDHVYDPQGVRGEMYYIPQPSQLPAKYHPTQWVGDRSLAFLDEQDDSQPFFLFASFIHPHPPFSPPTPWNKLYRGTLMPLPHRPHQCEAFHTTINRRQNRYKYRDNGIDNNLLRIMKAYYYACVSFIDFQVGRVLGALQAAGRLDNTLILHTSDHGEMLGDYNCFGKRTMLDPAARIPMLARLPDRFPAGARCETPVSLVDVLPTVLGAAGADSSDCDTDGVDLAEAAAGDHADRFVYSQYQRDAQGVHMALDRRWKYFYSAPDRQEFLIDRVGDPAETRNRAGVTFCREALASMRANLFDFYRRNGSTDPLDGDAWREYPQPDLPVDPDAGLLIQDAPWAAPFQAIPGYSD